MNTPNFRMTVTKVEVNPQYDEQKAQEASRRACGGYNYGTPYNEAPTIETQQLEVVLTPEEYEAVKRAVMEVWK